MINKPLFDQLKQLIETDQQEALVIIEQPSPYKEDESIRLIYDPSISSFVMGPNATIEGNGDEDVISPSYLLNIQSVNKYMFQDEEEWLGYVVSLWTTHSLNAFFMRELDPSYAVFSIIQNILNAEEDVSLVAELPDGTNLYYHRDDEVLHRKDEGGNILHSQELPENRDQKLATFFAFWDGVVQDAVKRAGLDDGEESVTEEDEEVIDLDNLYDGVEGNSANPIDASEPEVQEDKGCAGGGCTL